MITFDPRRDYGTPVYPIPAMPHGAEVKYLEEGADRDVEVNLDNGLDSDEDEEEREGTGFGKEK